MKQIMIFVLFFITINLSAQTNIEKLKHTQWVERYNNYPDFVVTTIFTDSLKITSISTEKYIYVAKYYLSDTIERKFNNHMLGHIKKGRYLIIKTIAPPKYPYLTGNPYEIVKYSRDSLLLEYCGVIFGGQYRNYKNEGKVSDKEIEEILKKKNIKFLK